MNQEIRHWTMIGYTCLVTVGCSSAVASLSTNYPASSGSSEQASNGDLASADHAGSPMSAAERRVSTLVERSLARVASVRTRNWSALGRKAEPRKKDNAEAELKSPNRPSQRVERLVSATDRGETLKVTGPSGDFCAAVSIASQLAVTALHCVQTLCETKSLQSGASLLGCKIDYAVPDGSFGEARVVATSENDLVALLDLQRPLSKYGALRCDDPRAEDRVYTVSHPNGSNWLLSYGRLTRDPIPLEWEQGEATRVLVAEIPTKYGSSGGGLFDVQDHVVGVQVARWSPWTTDFGKAAFIQATRIFTMAGRYCSKRGSSACVGLKCSSGYWDVWNFDAT